MSNSYKEYASKEYVDSKIIEIGGSGDNCVTVDGGGNLVIADELGNSPYVIEFTTEEEIITASNTIYDNTDSGLSATSAQDAIDELNTKKQNAFSTLGADIITYNNATSGMSASNIQAAVDEIASEVGTLSSEVNTLETGKQDNLVGTEGQIVSFDASGKPVATDPIAAAKAQNTILSATGWVEGIDGRFSQTISVAGVTSDPNQVIIVDVALSGTDLAADISIMEAWGRPDTGAGPASQNCKQGDGTLTFYCIVAPTVNIPLSVGVC